MKTSRKLSLVFGIIFLGCNAPTSEQLMPLTEGDLAPPPETVTVEILGYCPAAGRSYRDLFATNFSVKVLRSKLELDSDKDGVPDVVENANAATLNISTTLADSNGDGFSDLLMYLSGIDRNQQSRLRCTDMNNNSGDGISYIDPKIPGSSSLQFLGLRNCEKSRLMGTSPDDFDTDGDGITDYLELRCGLNPKDSNDAMLDTDGDGVSNYDECKLNTPIDHSNKMYGIKQYEYKYKIEADTRTGVACMKFVISNIPILNGGYDNLLAFYLTEMDGLQKEHLYTAFLPLQAGSVGKTFIFDFGPAPTGRFVGK